MNLLSAIAENIRLRKQNSRLAVKNIILTCDIRTIIDDPESDKAKQIIARYQKEIEIEKEIEQAGQN